MLQHRHAKWLVVLGVCLALSCCGAQQLWAAVNNAVNDFSLSSNPSTPWSYRYDLAGSAPLLSTQVSYMSGQLAGWSNGGTDPSWAGILKNTTSDDLTYNSGNTVQPNDVLYMDPQSSSVAVRWTAPSTGLWLIDGWFEAIDIPQNHPRVEVLLNSTTVLYSLTAMSSYGQTLPFSWTRSLQAGDILDFVVLVAANGDWTAQGTGLAVEISDVPEPTTLVIWSLLGGLAISAGWRWRKRAA